MARKITIVCTPRTGSNLLINALEAHPQAISAHEVYNPASHLPATQMRAKGLNPFELCNLFKVFVSESDAENFRRLLDDSYVVYLYREDRIAQFDSWERACRTGHWVKNQPQPQPHPVPKRNQMRKEVRLARRLFRPLADYCVSYEFMVENWDRVIADILAGAGWEPVKLVQRTEKQSSWEPKSQV